MSTITRATRATRRRGALVAAAIATTLITGAAPASPAPAPSLAPDAGAGLDLTAGIGMVFHGAVIADDAVYYTVESANPTLYDFIGLYGRSRVTTASGTVLGPAQLLDRIGIATVFTERDGTLAYLQAETGRAVLRAPDGTVTEEVWSDSPGVHGGVAELTDSWVVGADYPWEPTYVLVNRATAVTYDLADLVTIPAGYQWAYVTEIHVTDTQVAWSVYAEGSGVDGYFTGVYTAPLDADGPGAVTVLAERLGTGSGAQQSTDLIDLDGTRLAWTTSSWTWPSPDACATTLSWYDAAPYTGTPSSLPVGCSTVLGVEGGTAVAFALPWDPGVLAWRELAGTGTPSTTYAFSGDLVAARGTLAVTSGVPTNMTTIVDVSGLPVTGDQTAPLLPAPFVDMRNDDPFRWETLRLADQGIVGGYPDGTFRPLSAVNRDAMAAFLYRAAGEPAFTPPTTPTFADVPTYHPFFAEVEWLAATGITTGWTVGDDTEFRPGTPVTREAMAAFLYRFAYDGADAPACTTAPFADVAAGQRFCGEIAWLADAGVSQGWPDHTFRPALNVERQAMAAFLARFLEL